MKGLILNIAALSLLLLLISLSTILFLNLNEIDRALLTNRNAYYSKYYFDDVRTYILSLVFNASVTYSNTSVNVTFSETVPKQNLTLLLTTYKSLLENNYGTLANANFSLNISEYTKGDYTLKFYGWLYNVSYANDRISFLRNSTSANDVQGYVVNITNSKSRKTFTNFVLEPTGSMNLTFRYQDLNGTIELVGNINPAINNTASMVYSDNSTITIIINNDIFLLSSENVSFPVSFTSSMKPNRNFSKTFTVPLTFNYTQSTFSKYSELD